MIELSQGLPRQPLACFPTSAALELVPTSVSESAEGASPRNAKHSRSFPHFQEIWGSVGQSSSGGNPPVRSRWIRAYFETLEVVLAQAARKSDEQADGKVARVAKVQFDEHEGVLNARRLQSILDVHIANLGIEVFARLVRASKPIANRADAKDGSHVAQA